MKQNSTRIQLGLAVIWLLAILPATGCATTGDYFKGTKGNLGPTVHLNDIPVDDPDNVMVSGAEYRFVPMFDSGWTHEVYVKDGRMYLTLGTPPGHILKPFTGHIPEAKIATMKPETAKGHETSFFYKEETIGLSLEYIRPFVRGKPTFDFVYPYYVNEDAIIKDTITLKGAGGQTKTTYNLTLKSGWNVVNRVASGTTTRYKVGEPRSGFKWIVRRQPSFKVEEVSAVDTVEAE